ncbi:MAG: hypothetical protein KDI32_15855, partial [Pseudomonadales bacterium]|nr:hypothetical protein [Pseudomonadales bacterium]
MHHTIVTRVSIVLTTLCLCAAAAFAWLVSPGAVAQAEPTPTSTPVASDALFAKYCGGCHTQEEMLAVLRKSDDLAANAAEMQRFLERHGRSSAE